MAHMIRLAVLLLAAVLAPLRALAQAPSTQDADDPLRFDAAILVIASKEPEDKQKVPISLTAVTKETLDRMGAAIVSDAAILAPNTLYTEFTARSQSSPRFRGIGGSQSIPGITTYIDGVPQLRTNSANIELIDVGQIEFVRGPRSALFGRNTLGGLVNVTSVRPSTAKWGGAFSVPFGDFSAWAARGAASGPVNEQLSLGFSFAQVERDGFTVNDVTGRDVDRRSGTSLKGQALWKPARNWETQVIVSGERARDGDYALNDYDALRANPFHVSRDFEGHTDRDIFNTTIQARHEGARVTLSANTAFVKWKTQDVTDLDYSPFPIVTRDNTEEDFQFTQEVRFASARTAPVRLADRASLKWQAGAFFFTQNYDQNAVNNISPGLFGPVAVALHSPAELDDAGVGLFGQGTLTFDERLDVTVGARFDYEDKNAVLSSFYEPPLQPPTATLGDKSFSNLSPQVAVAFRPHPDVSVYGDVSRGFKAGGFNASSPAGREAFDEELAWHYEAGLKSVWLQGRVLTNAAVFYIDWDQLQTFLPNPQIPTQFFVGNAGEASSKGVELEVSARPARGVDVFSAIGFTNAQFGDGSTTSGIDISGNEIPLAPDYTVSLGVQYAHPTRYGTVFGRADVVWYGSFQYDDLNTVAQGAYSLTNLRAGVTIKSFVVEAFMRNAFDERYIPVLFPYGDFAPSGYLGEIGAPRTFGMSAGVRF